MNILLLPGGSIGNKEWIDGLANTFKDSFDDIKTIHYDHWKTREKFGNLDVETEKSLKSVQNWKNYIIVSKSFGCLIALKLIEKVENKPNKIFLIGFPVALAQRIDFPLDSLLKEIGIELVFIQKPEDPAYSYSKLVDFIGKIRPENYKVIEYMVKSEPIDNHHYASCEYLKKLVTKEVE